MPFTLDTTLGVASYREIDVSVASTGTSDSVVVPLDVSVTWLFDLTALSGGTSPSVTVTWETSPDDGVYYPVASETALTTAGYRLRLDDRGLLPYVRVAWTTSGSPTTATADLTLVLRGDA